MKKITRSYEFRKIKNFFKIKNYLFYYKMFNENNIYFVHYNT